MIELLQEDRLARPDLLQLDVIDSIMLDDEEFMDQLMGTFDDSGEGLLSDLDEDFGAIIDDDVCGDSLDMMDMEADEYINSYNNMIDEDDDIIDWAIGLKPI